MTFYICFHQANLFLQSWLPFRAYIEDFIKFIYFLICRVIMLFVQVFTEPYCDQRMALRKCQYKNWRNNHRWSYPLISLIICVNLLFTIILCVVSCVMIFLLVVWRCKLYIYSQWPNNCHGWFFKLRTALLTDSSPLDHLITPIESWFVSYCWTFSAFKNSTYTLNFFLV